MGMAGASFRLMIVAFFLPYWMPQVLSSSQTLLLPLKARAIPSRSRVVPRSPSKLFFHHNVSLTVSLSVGSPPQNVTMVLDTGSELSWLHCGRIAFNRSVFNPNRSRSYSPVGCISPTCKLKTRDLNIPASCDSAKLCHTAVTYADMTSIEGNLAADNFVVGNSPAKRLLFGCMDSGTSTNAEEDAKATGLLGMNRGSLSMVTQMNFSKFSYCISGQDSSGVLLFGDASLDWLHSLNYTPMVSMTTPLPYFDRIAYTVNLEGIKVGGWPVEFGKDAFKMDHTGAGQAIVDSGSQFSFLQGSVYTLLKGNFSHRLRSNPAFVSMSGFVFQGGMDLCYQALSDSPDFSRLPTVTLMLAGAEMKISGERLLYRVPGMKTTIGNVYCFTFGNSELLGIETFIIGHHHQQNMWMEFDLTNSRVGLAEFQCDVAGQKLGMHL